MRKEKAIITFVKYPERGKVKTRLAASTGKSFAAQFYNLIATNTFNEIYSLIPEVDIYIFYSAADRKSDIKDWVGREFNYIVQQGAELGEKMNNAFKRVFEEGYSKAIILGTDIPETNSRIINNAFLHLSDYEIVISPSSDGGYSLLGLQKNYSFLFNNIKWSTSSVYETTTRKIYKNSISYKKLNILNDIDTKQDLLLWIRSTKNESLRLKVKKLAEEEGVKL